MTAVKTTTTAPGKAAKLSLIVGVVALAICGFGATQSAKQFYQSYLVAFMWCLGPALGCLGLRMIHALTGGEWGRFLRGPLQAAMTSLPVLGLLFIPILVGVTDIYPWSFPGAENDHLIHHKAAWLNVPFFRARAVLYLVIWSGLALVLYRRAQAYGLGPGSSRSMRVLAGPGILVYAVTMTFAAIDWIMSLEPHWFSTLFGVLLVGGQLLSAMTFCLVVTTHYGRKEKLTFPVDALHDAGKLCLAFTMVWAYLSFSQLIIIYAGNMAEDIPWYLHRSHAGWMYVSIVVAVCHFVVPFLVLLSSKTKRNPRLIGAVATWLFLMRLVELYWITAPNFSAHDIHLHWMDILAPIGVGGVWFAAVLHRLGKDGLTFPAAESHAH